MRSAVPWETSEGRTHTGAKAPGRTRRAMPTMSAHRGEADILWKGRGDANVLAALTLANAEISYSALCSCRGRAAITGSRWNQKGGSIPTHTPGGVPPPANGQTSPRRWRMRCTVRHGITWSRPISASGRRGSPSLRRDQGCNRLIMEWLTLYDRAMSTKVSPASRLAIASWRW